MLKCSVSSWRYDRDHFSERRTLHVEGYFRSVWNFVRIDPFSVFRRFALSERFERALSSTLPRNTTKQTFHPKPPLRRSTFIRVEVLCCLLHFHKSPVFWRYRVLPPSCDAAYSLVLLFTSSIVHTTLAASKTSHVLTKEETITLRLRSRFSPPTTLDLSCPHALEHRTLGLTPRTRSPPMASPVAQSTEADTMMPPPGK